jgi:hypothetical protein
MDDIPKSHLQNMLELYMTSITITLSIQLSLMLYRKLKGKNDSIKDVDKKRTQVQNHQMPKSSTSASASTGSSSQASKGGHKSPNTNQNPLMRLITRFTGTGTGNGTQYQELQFNEAEFECRQGGEQVSIKKPETAEAGCQVCQEIIQKRERRNRVRGGAAGGAGGSGSDGGDDVEANECFTQDIFASEDESAATAVEPSEVKYTCAVCLDEDISLGSGNTTMTECGHVFHLTCLLKSLCQKNLCPMCRAPLEDVREKQMPANILTPVSAEQMVAEEISYFSNAAHVQSITSSRHPKRCFKEALRVFGFTLLRTVAEYVHGENMPVGWYDDDESETESSEGDNDNEDADNQDDNQSDQSDQSDQSEEEQYDDDNDNRSDDEFNYAVRRVARIRDLRDSIGN